MSLTVRDAPARNEKRRGGMPQVVERNAALTRLFELISRRSSIPTAQIPSIAPMVDLIPMNKL
jgi:hypothetical protein